MTSHRPDGATRRRKRTGKGWKLMRPDRKWARIDAMSVRHKSIAGSGRWVVRVLMYDWIYDRRPHGQPCSSSSARGCVYFAIHK